VRRLTDGEVIFKEGEPGDAWYVIFEGQARVLKGADHGAWQVRLMERGECFGEIALLDGQPRSATVLAAGTLTVFRFSRPRFEDLLEQGSLGAYKLVLAMARMLSQRHRELTQRLSELVSDDPPAMAQFQISE
jgi:CRP/FNR family cyclic AMP-dependent transcriptional regulator